ncbi:MAG TPA: flavin reductase family protein, partial [Actinopolymorphaceae bacterium]
DVDGRASARRPGARTAVGSAGVLDDAADRTDALPPVDLGRYKSALRRLASGVTVVTTRVEDMDHAMTATAFAPVSLRPPLVMVCVDRSARIHTPLIESVAWGVSLLAATPEARAASTWLATRGRPLEGQLDEIAVSRGVTGVALLRESVARLECRTAGHHRAGDHTIVLGEVVAAEEGGPDTPPLVYHAGDYSTTTPWYRTEP